MNRVKSFREACGLTQVQFASAIGRSYVSVQNYEAGKTVPSDVLERMRTLSPAEFDARFGEETPIEARHAEWHRRLDRILNGKRADAIEAIKSNLVAFDHYAATEDQQLPMGITLEIETSIPGVKSFKRKVSDEPQERKKTERV